MAGALFALHPIQTEPVDWIAAVTDLEVTSISSPSGSLLRRRRLEAGVWSGTVRLSGVARTAAFAVRVFSLGTIGTVPYSIVRQTTDRNSGVLSFPISSSPCASSNGERDSPSLTSPCWRAPSTGPGRYILST